MKTGRRIATTVAVLAVVVPAAYFVGEYLSGRHMVEKLCARDGGVFSLNEVATDGFLDETVHDPGNCFECADYLGSGRFTHIDTKWPPVTPGYVRFQIAQIGDERCNPPAEIMSKAALQNVVQMGHLKQNQCIAVEKLLELPDEPVLRDIRTAEIDAGDHHIEEFETSIRYARSGRVTALVRDYKLWARLFDYTSVSGQNTADASCGRAVEEAAAKIRRHDLLLSLPLPVVKSRLEAIAK